jgi:hypothetical protein
MKEDEYINPTPVKMPIGKSVLWVLLQFIATPIVAQESMKEIEGFGHGAIFYWEIW